MVLEFVEGSRRDDGCLFFVGILRGIALSRMG